MLRLQNLGGDILSVSSIKTNHDDKDFKESEFLLRKFVKLFKMDALQFPTRTSHRSISSSKKSEIIDKLGSLMPSNRLLFYEGFKTNDESEDLLDSL